MIVNILIILFKLVLCPIISYVSVVSMTKIIIKKKSLNIKNIDEIIDIKYYDIEKNNNEEISNNMSVKDKEKLYKYRKK